MRNRAQDKEWVEQEYERLMGHAALARQRAAAEADKRVKAKAATCNCGWKEARSHVVGPHHSVTCPKYAIEPEEEK